MNLDSNPKVRILVDHSGYALANIGDVAMLQGCVRRLRTLWPDSEITVFTESPERLREMCPGTEPVVPSIIGRPWASRLPISAQLLAEQIWKIGMPMFGGRGPRRARRATSQAGQRIFQREAIRRADIVVSSGGGFVNDVFWYHAMGVLSVLGMAQRCGKPTAMFGQGIGPITQPLLRRVAMRVMPSLAVIGLREGFSSVDLLQSLGVDPKDVLVTGDDALVLATPEKRPATGSGIGLNVRVAAYSKVGEGVGDQIVSVVRRVAEERDVPILALPVEHNRAISDLDAILSAGSEADNVRAYDELSDIETPDELTDRVSRCGVVVTGSYHAAVFGLAAGVPAVCLSNSQYYDGKFFGLAQLFPSGCQIVRPGENLASELRSAIARALSISDEDRDRIHQSALVQVTAGDEAYRNLKAMVDGSAAVESCPMSRQDPVEAVEDLR